MATIKKRGNTFQICCSLGRDANGRQIRKTTTYKPPEGTTPKKAEKLAQKAAVEFEKKCHGLAALDENMKFEELVKMYFEMYGEKKLKPVTLYNYRLATKKRFIPEFGNCKLKDFSPARISKFFCSLNDLEPSSCKKLLTVLQSIFSFGVKQGLIEKSPCRNIILPDKKKKDNSTKNKLTEAEIHQLVELFTSDDMKDTQLSTIVLTQLHTGVRPSEALGLQWRDIDFEHGMIHIVHNLADVAGEHFLDEPKTKKSKRTIALSAELAEILKAHRARQSRYLLENSIRNKNNTVFISNTGDFKDRNQTLKEFKSVIEGTTFEKLTLHGLRHLNATLLLANGVDIKLVSENLGHTTISVTADIYSDVLEKSKREMAELISLKLA